MDDKLAHGCPINHDRSGAPLRLYSPPYLRPAAHWPSRWSTVTAILVTADWNILAAILRGNDSAELELLLLGGGHLIWLA